MTRSHSIVRQRAAAVVLATAVAAGACRETGPAPPDALPVYSPDTGQLEQLVADRDGDGLHETRAFMDGRRLDRIEIDRDGDGRPDRWEYYGEAPPDRAIQGSPAGRAEILRVEETAGPEGPVTRREFYERGALQRVEADADADGRIDRWEFYVDGELNRLEMDLGRQGFADRRFVYGAGGRIDRVETNPEGDGRWRVEPLQP